MVDDVASVDDHVRIGARLRRSRIAAGMTVSDLAERTGLTKGFLSLVERDKANPSVASLVRVCQALDIPVGALFEPAQADFVPRAARSRINFGGQGVEEYLLTPHGQTRLQVIESLIEPGGGSGSEEYALRADTEVVHVVKGRLQVTISGAIVDMRAGDSLTFTPSDPHSWRNPSPRHVAHVLWIVTPAPQ